MVVVVVGGVVVGQGEVLTVRRVAEEIYARGGVWGECLVRWVVGMPSASPDACICVDGWMDLTPPFPPLPTLIGLHPSLHAYTH